MYKNAVIEALMLKRDIALLHDEINALKSKLAKHDHDAQPEMQFVPIESAPTSVAPSPAPSPSPAPTPDPIPPPSPLCEPEPICEPRLNATSEPRPDIFSPNPTKRCVSCAFARTCLKCKHRA